MSSQAHLKAAATSCALSVSVVTEAGCEAQISACSDAELGALAVVSTCFDKVSTCVPSADGGTNGWYETQYLACSASLSGADGGAALVSERCLAAVRP